MNRLFTPILLITLSLLHGCASDEAGDKRIKGDNYTFLKSGSAYRQALNEREQPKPASFTIHNVDPIMPDAASPILRIRVSHQTKCGKHFEVVWDGAIMESFPPRINLLLRLPQECENTEAIQEQVILLDIRALTGTADLPSNTVFHIINGSQTNDVNDQNVSSN